jgi:hypothetical protein
MYMTRMIEVSKATNGYVLECRVPLKPEAKSTSKMDTCCCGPSGGSCEKQYVAKDAKEVADLIADIMPLLDGDYKTEDEFDSAFKAACGDTEDEED